MYCLWGHLTSLFSCREFLWKGNCPKELKNLFKLMKVTTLSWINLKFNKNACDCFFFRQLKVAEHSFCACFRGCNSARAQGLQKTNMPSIERSFYLLNTCSICAIFLYNWTQCIDGFSLLLQRYVRKGNDVNNPAILNFFFLTERTQLNAAHA